MMGPMNRSRGGGQMRQDNRKAMNESMSKQADKNKSQLDSKDQKPGVNMGKMNQGQSQSASMSDMQEDKKNLSMMSEKDENNEEQGEAAPGPKKFTGRCRLFVGNLPNDTTEKQFRTLFAPYGELSEVFVNPSRGFGFVRLATRQDAEAAKAALDGLQKKNRVLRVRFATHGAALRVKFLPSHVSNELLEEAFAHFGPVERAIVIVDDRGKPTGEGIVEFERKPAAQQALLKINEGAFLLGASPRPVLVEPLEQRDEEDGYPEKFIMHKNAQFHKEREQGPRFVPPGSFEFEMAQKWKEVYRMEAEHKVQLQREMEQAIVRLELEQEQALHEHQAMLLRQDLMRRQEELRKLEERQMEMAKRMEMRRQEEDIRRQEEERHRQEVRMRQQQEQEMRRRQLEGRTGRGVLGAPGDEFDMRGGSNRSMDRVGRTSFNDSSEMRGRGDLSGRSRDFNEGQSDMGSGLGSGNMGGGNMAGGGSMSGGMGSGNMGSGRGGNMSSGNMQSSGMGSGGGNMRRGNEGGSNAPPMQPPPAPPAALGLERQRQAAMGGNQGGSGGMGGGNGNNLAASGGQGGFGGNNMGPGSNMGNTGGMGNNAGGNMGPGNNMGGRGPMGGAGNTGMNRRREGGPREEYFDSKRPRF